MIRPKNPWHGPWPLVAVLSVGVALLASGCMWGFAVDQNTGAPVSDATVNYTDSAGRTGSTTTDANGLYSFPFPGAPLTGPITLDVSSPSHPQQTMARVVDYSDNPNASLSNILSFWEIQNLVLGTSGGGPPPPPPPGSVILCEDPQYGGLCETVPGSDPNLADNAIGDNRASSIVTHPGETVELCDLPNFGGTCEPFTGHDPDLSDNLIGDDRTSSVRFPQGGCAPPPPPPNAVTLCQDPGYCGLCETFTSPGGDPNLADNGIGDNQASSIMVNPGTTVELCDLPNFGGTCEPFTADDPDLSDNLIGDDRASSIGFPIGQAANLDLICGDLRHSNPWTGPGTGGPGNLIVVVGNLSTDQWGNPVPVNMNIVLECTATTCSSTPCNPPPWPTVYSQTVSVSLPTPAGGPIEIQTAFGWDESSVYAAAECRILVGGLDSFPADNGCFENTVQ